jgi:hypothetical protein
VRNLGHIENLSLYLDTKLIFLILEILAIGTLLHVIVLVTTSSILKPVDKQGVMMSVFAQPDPVFDHGNNSVNI